MSWIEINFHNENILDIPITRHTHYSAYPLLSIPINRHTHCSTHPLSFHEDNITVASFTKEINPRLAKRQLIYKGRLTNRGPQSCTGSRSVDCIRLVASFTYIWDKISRKMRMQCAYMTDKNSEIHKSLPHGRCGSNFRTIVFRLTVQNSNEGTLC